MNRVPAASSWRSGRSPALPYPQSVWPLRLSQLDTRHELFNCLNCTFDLEKMEPLPHDSAQMLSKISGADFVPGARCERWERFIDEIMMGDREVARYLQKLLGYCLMGDPVEEKFFILFGATTRNGKSSLLDTISAVMGDYARAMSPETLAELRTHDGSRATPDIARMAGVRLATVNELPKDMKPNNAMVKSITGRDTITARNLYQNNFEYKPQFVLILNTNYLPDITDMTLFTSGRIVVIPFKRHFSENEQQKNLKHELRSPKALSGVLNWLLEGLKLYREEGLEPSSTIKAEIAQYQRESDTIAKFIEECIKTAPGKENYVFMSSVHEAYVLWCADNAYKPEPINRAL